VQAAPVLGDLGRVALDRGVGERSVTMTATAPEPARCMTSRSNLGAPACLIAFVTSSEVTVSASSA
jgi:hypothetical protein